MTTKRHAGTVVKATPADAHQGNGWGGAAASGLLLPQHPIDAMFGYLAKRWFGRQAGNVYVIGHRSGTNGDGGSWWERAGPTDPVLVVKPTRVLILARETATTKSFIKMLRRDELCYVKYGRALKHFVTALGAFDHYFIGPCLDLDDQDSIRKIVRRTNLDLSRVAFLEPTTFLHWSGTQEAAVFQPVRKATRRAGTKMQSKS